MCCLFGVYAYGDHFTHRQLKKIISNLGIVACARGTDATGIAYLQNRTI